MVGPTPDEDQQGAMARLKFLLVALVGVSAGLITISGGGSVVDVGIAVVAGLAIGAALLAYLVTIA